MNIFRLLKNKIFKIISLNKNAHKLACRIEEIDSIKNQVTLYVLGTSTIIQLDIAEAINDCSIIFNLPSFHACLLGYYHGKYARKSGFDSQTTTNLQWQNSGNFNLKSQELDGSLVYVDKRTNKIFKDFPISICKNESTISQFDPSQACYIGKLAGMSTYKKSQTSRKSLSPLKPYLRLIK